MERRRGAQGTESKWLLSVGLLAFLLFVPIRLTASTLRSIQASSSSSDKTILSLRFDSSDPVRLTTARGRILELQGGFLPAEGINVRSRGLFAAIRPSGGGIEIIGTHYLAGRLTPAGAGAYLLFLEAATEPKPASPPPTNPAETVQNPATKPLKSSQGEDLRGSAPASREQKPTTPPDELESRAGMQPRGIQQGGSIAVPSILPEVVRIGAQIADQGDVDRALAYLATIQPSESGFGWSRVVMGELIEQQGDLSRALDVYREALTDPSTESVASVHLALAFQAQGNPEAASGMWARVLELSGGSLYIPVDTPSSRPIAMQTASSQQRDDDAADKEEGGRPLWLTIILILVGLALVGGIGFGVYTLVKLINKRKGEMPDELALEDDLLESMDTDDAVLEMPTAPPPKPKGAVANAAKAYEETTQASAPEPLTFGPGDEIDPEALAVLAPAEDAGTEELSDAKRKKLEAMYRQGSTVREIAETLGVGQDEVRMAINLAEASGS
ncbi:hypothetical protein KQI63_02440 [bacterium]|nr:hypothetical protein [bacterium]